MEDSVEENLKAMSHREYDSGIKETKGTVRIGIIFKSLCKHGNRLVVTVGWSRENCESYKRGKLQFNIRFSNPRGCPRIKWASLNGEVLLTTGHYVTIAQGYWVTESSCHGRIPEKDF